MNKQKKWKKCASKQDCVKYVLVSKKYDKCYTCS